MSSFLAGRKEWIVMEGMEALHHHVGGIDVHRKSLSVCVRHVGADRQVRQEVRTFGTMTRDLLVLRDWLEREGVTHVAMEATGVLWKPVYNLLEGRLEVLLVNAHHVKQVEGRKTDVKDCQWLAQLLSCGLLRASFIPRRPQRELRDLTRMRSQLVAERTRVANRIHKVLEDANIQLGAVATDILGVSGREMIEALIQGEQDTEKMAQMARQRLRGKIPQLRLALDGRVNEHHQFLLKMLLAQYDERENQIGQLTERIEKVCTPFAAAIDKIIEVPGYNRTSAQNVVAEIGADMKQFPSDDHLCSWATMCPGNRESAGKRKSGRTLHGNRWLKAALCQSAWAAVRTKGSYFGAQYHRLAGRRGKKRALVAVAHAQLRVIYHLLRTGESYQDLGADYFAKLNGERTVRYHRKVLESLGYTIIPPAADQAA
jgi:transposase